ncbi:MAG: hypothetical protein SFX73_00870 [Kofleriaceae bacterium]|nr:hypothetical protein [Kofleriaceae bacterium]
MLVFILGENVKRLLDDNEIDLAKELRRLGLAGARMDVLASGDGTRREPISVILIAASVPILAVGAAVAQIVRALQAGPVVVEDEIVETRDGKVTRTIERSVVQPTVEATKAALSTELPLGIRVTMTTGPT